MKKRNRINVSVIEVSSLGDRSYLVHDTHVALVIDPQRDIESILSLAEKEKVLIKAIFETHIHNDYVSGGLSLAQTTGATYYISSAEKVQFEHVAIAPNTVIAIGSLLVKTLHTPGHTPHHLSYLITMGQEQMVFTGGSMLYGTIGRTDLVNKDVTESLTKAQFNSVHTLAKLLPGETAVYPTHGFGSFCSTLISSKATTSTIKQEKEQNIAFSLSEENFIKQVLASLDNYPSYYSHMAPLNRQGAKSPILGEFPMVQEQELLSLLEKETWIVDIRKRTIFAEKHLYKTVNIEMGNSFVTYVGWIVPWEKELVLIGESKKQIMKAQKELARIGRERIRASSSNTINIIDPKYRLSYPMVDFKKVKNVYENQEITILDVRQQDEWEQSHIKGAINIPIHTLNENRDKLPSGELWVHCVSGFRAAIGASLLHGEGRSVILINDDYENAKQAGLPLASQ